MRIALPRLLRRRPRLNATHILQKCQTGQLVHDRLQAQCLQFTPCFITVREFHHDDGKHKRNKHVKSGNSRGTQYEYDSLQEPVLEPVGGPRVQPDAFIIPEMSQQERQNPETWVQLLEKYLPEYMRHGVSEQDKNSRPQSDQCCGEILELLHTARKRKNTGTDILAYMIIGTRRKAALWICDLLLKNLALKYPDRLADQLPSNIVWPNKSLYNMTGRNFSVDDVLQPSWESCEDWMNPGPDPRYSTVFTDVRNSTMDQIWSTLGSVVVQSANMENEQTQLALNAVQLVLGHVHNLDLLPDNIYTYNVSSYSAAVQRPPILHLVSSRILTALSDAAWRVQQEENIERAASHGLSYKEIGRDPPGGRFRLKVSPLGAEIWLEFILWCCVEGGFASAGLRTINLLQQDAKDPWFAITWTKSNDTSHTAPYIDWNRVKSRTGGTVGRLEGYSKGQPLATAPRRTISTEVVLALIEIHIDFTRQSPNGKGMTLQAAQVGIVKLCSFLEPHSLPVSYFDYISSRLLLTGGFEAERSKVLRRWSDDLSFLRSLRTAQPPPFPRTSFKLGDLLAQSEFNAGFMHQVLDSCVEESNIFDALKVFNDIQKLVDNSKLIAIGSFLQTACSPHEDFFSSRFYVGRPDFVSSHGQLPMHKLAGLLNLSTDSTLVGFGQWLVYNTDPDGPLIPESEYANSAIAPALIRFAGSSNDTQLLHRVASSIPRTRLPTVNLLRTSFNANIALLDFDAATNVMERLRYAQGGGFGLSNLASLAGAILRLESDRYYADSRNENSKLHRATILLEAMLEGRFDARSGVFHKTVRHSFRQQVGHLLTVFETFRDSSIAKLASLYRDRYRASNLPNVAPAIFNTLVEAVVETRSAKVSTEFIDRFCTTNEDGFGPDHVSPESFMEDESDPESAELMEESYERHVSRKPHIRSAAQTFIPFVTDSDPDRLVEEVSKETLRGVISPEMTGFTSPYFQEKGMLPSPESSNKPVCVADMRTIRLVVRKANREWYDHNRTGQRYEDHDYVLDWATQKFSELGCSSDMISNEIKETLGKGQQISTRGLSRAPAAKIRKITHRNPHPSKGRSSRVSKTFVGKDVMGDTDGSSVKKT